jgi:hypothetical protein
MNNPTEVLALVIAEKQEQINNLKTELQERDDSYDRVYRWWQEEEVKVRELQAKVAELEAELKKADPTRNAIALSNDA